MEVDGQIDLGERAGGRGKGGGVKAPLSNPEGMNVATNLGLTAEEITKANS